MQKAYFSLFSALVPLALVATGACSSGLATDPDGSADASTDRNRPARPFVVDAGCAIVVDDHSLLDSPHVAIDTPVTYNSNPPTSGPHYPVWAAFQEYQKPVDRRYYVHDLEHGAVVLAYNCQAAGDAGSAATACNAIVEGLRAAVAALPDDPLCDGEGVRVRYVITPDPLLDVPIAAAAWGTSYRAQCLDVPSLVEFLKTTYGQGPESLCGNGQPMP